jgi:hypothetical protein
MGRKSVAWFVGSVATIILGFVLTAPAPSVGTVVVVAGILGLTGFLLYVFRVATTQEDQWVWQTPGKPRREHLAEEAAKRESESAPTTPDA